VFSLLIVIIYIAFISLGLPDSLLGSAWPVMRTDMELPLSYAGIITIVIASGTVISSLLSDRLTKKLGAGLVTAISVAMTAAALFGFSVSGSLWMLLLFAIPYGLGAGAVDAALNNYVALHYSSRVMSWLHCFWGVGASISPYIMSFFLARGNNWSGGYRCVSFIQIALTVLLFATLPLWKENDTAAETEKTEPIPLKKVLRIPNVAYIMLAFFGYCGIESTFGLWSASYLVEYRQVETETAAMFASFCYIGLTVGRFISGFFADKLGDRKMIRYGLIILAVGVVLIGLPGLPVAVCLTGFLIAGLGCAPIYPSIIHSTPANFGRENSQAVVGVQMASAYVGSTLLPPLFGLIANHINIGLYPLYIAVFITTTIVMTEKLNKAVKIKGEN